MTGGRSVHELEVALAAAGGRLADLRTLAGVLGEERARRGLEGRSAPEWRVRPDALLAEPARSWSDLDVVAGVVSVGEAVQVAHSIAVDVAGELDVARREAVLLGRLDAEASGVVVGVAVLLGETE